MVNPLGPKYGYRNPLGHRSYTRPLGTLSKDQNPTSPVPMQRSDFGSDFRVLSQHQTHYLEPEPLEILLTTTFKEVFHDEIEDPAFWERDIGDLGLWGGGGRLHELLGGVELVGLGLACEVPGICSAHVAGWSPTATPSTLLRVPEVVSVSLHRVFSGGIEFWAS